MNVRRFAPLAYDDLLRREPEDDYVQRMQRTHLPNMPQDVLHHWLYRNWGGIADDYIRLGLDTLEFGSAPEQWSMDEVPILNCWAYHVIHGFEKDFDYWLQKGEWLAKYMNKYGTWPVPILLFDNYDGLLSPRDYDDAPGIPYHLLEGHRRLGFFAALKSRNGLRAAHEVWLVSKAR